MFGRTLKARARNSSPRARRHVGAERSLTHIQRRVEPYRAARRQQSELFKPQGSYTLDTSGNAAQTRLLDLYLKHAVTCRYVPDQSIGHELRRYVAVGGVLRGRSADCRFGLKSGRFDRVAQPSNTTRFAASS